MIFPKRFCSSLTESLEQIHVKCIDVADTNMVYKSRERLQAIKIGEITMPAAAEALERPASNRARKDISINLRLPAMTRDLIDAAANATGKTRTEFVIESAKQHAVDVLLDQRFFTLDKEQSERFFQILDNPPKPNEKLRDLLKRKSPWEK